MDENPHQESPTPFFEILASTADGVFAVDTDQRVAFWNESATRILGIGPEEALGRPCYELLTGSNGARCASCGPRCQTFRASLGGELSPTREIRVRTRKGREIEIGITTLLLPSRWRDLSLLAHLFRETTRRDRVRPQRLARDLGAAHRHGPESLPAPCEPLTDREAEVLRLLASGASTARICSRLRIRTTTVRSHVQHILEKLDAHSRIEAVARAARLGLFRRLPDDS